MMMTMMVMMTRRFPLSPSPLQTTLLLHYDDDDDIPKISSVVLFLRYSGEILFIPLGRSPILRSGSYHDDFLHLHLSDVLCWIHNRLSYAWRAKMNLFHSSHFIGLWWWDFLSNFNGDPYHVSHHYWPFFRYIISYQ